MAYAVFRTAATKTTRSMRQEQENGGGGVVVGGKSALMYPLLWIVINTTYRNYG